MPAFLRDRLWNVRMVRVRRVVEHGFVHVMRPTLDEAAEAAGGLDPGVWELVEATTENVEVDLLHREVLDPTTADPDHRIDVRFLGITTGTETCEGTSAHEHRVVRVPIWETDSVENLEDRLYGACPEMDPERLRYAAREGGAVFDALTALPIDDPEYAGAAVNAVRAWFMVERPRIG